jgi:hypothetical protein
MTGMRLIFLLTLLTVKLMAQPFPTGSVRLMQLQGGGALPEKILNGRTVVLYSPAIRQQEIPEIHDGLVQAGIDIVAYFETDRVLAGYDAELAFAKYFAIREVVNLVIVDKAASFYTVSILPVPPKKDQVDLSQPAWQVSDASLKEALRQVYSTALNTYKRQNMLIIDVPETELQVNIIEGRRTEAYASDLRVDRLAVQKTGDEETDRQLEEIMKTYPYKYALVDPSIPELDLRKQGYFYILRFVHARGPIAKQLLGYEMTIGATAIASVTFDDGAEKVKTIPADRPVYKFYFRQIEFNNVYLGTRWDADTTWQQSMQNFIAGFRKEMRVN